MASLRVNKEKFKQCIRRNPEDENFVAVSLLVCGSHMENPSSLDKELEF